MGSNKPSNSKGTWENSAPTSPRVSSSNNFQSTNTHNPFNCGKHNVKDKIKAIPDPPDNLFKPNTRNVKSSTQNKGTKPTTVAPPPPTSFGTNNNENKPTPS
ncbi:uncharacterized protein GO595_011078 [Histomonas meleagridis]|uniref:uncharacterized protein n=1 Tax=Histomonas meleagridis TaxID=135588 RepID=UPI00355A9C52|nr:hypothetical protein GO595_011078 [Histomonas meleagridis]